MALIVPCPGCNTQLKVGASPGQQFKCPKCFQILTVPSDARLDKGFSSEARLDKEVLPAPEDSLSNPSLAAPETDKKLCPFCGESILANASKCKFCGEFLDGSRHERSHSFQRSQSDDFEPHRGGLILALGILSLVVCAPLGIFAWVMGSSDLGKIRSGRMDRSGEGTTQGGYICGIIGSVLFIIQIIAIGFFLFVACLGATIQAERQPRRFNFNTTPEIPITPIYASGIIPQAMPAISPLAWPMPGPRLS
ncbi:MAG: DUF4190 domain-containing protein [Gemmataceae bacterium]|nr:DUF4190 domain-containing protein [Gemmataceae bacterium]